jgi:hypothetical protein
MIRRCTNPQDRQWAYYGGRGITVAPRWLALENFLADMGPRPSPRHSIDRIDNARGYEPGNVRWTTAAVQTRNTRRTILLTFNGTTQCLADWAQSLGVSPMCLWYRVRAGWDVERILTTPSARPARQR